MDLGKILKEKRIEKGMTQAELAEKAGVTVRAITYWEGRKKCMTVESADRVFRALDEQLLIGAENGPLDKEESYLMDFAELIPGDIFAPCINGDLFIAIEPAFIQNENGEKRYARAVSLDDGKLICMHDEARVLFYPNVKLTLIRGADNA